MVSARGRLCLADNKKVYKDNCISHRLPTPGYVSEKHNQEGLRASISFHVYFYLTRKTDGNC